MGSVFGEDDLIGRSQRKNKQQTICNLLTFYLYFFISFGFFQSFSLVWIVMEMFGLWRLRFLYKIFQQHHLHYCTFQYTRAKQHRCTNQTQWPGQMSSFLFVPPRLPKPLSHCMGIEWFLTQSVGCFLMNCEKTAALIGGDDAHLVLRYCLALPAVTWPPDPTAQKRTSSSCLGFSSWGDKSDAPFVGMGGAPPPSPTHPPSSPTALSFF